MSGIAGIIHFDGKPVEPGLIQKMTSAMAHRGPDGINHWVKGSVALGQCMLCTTPESLEEQQPLANEDESLVMVMDGRVDNWEELRQELLKRGAFLRDRSDAELVLRAYEIWGEECPERIIGELVFFIWDSRHFKFYGARDVAGTRHFHYSEGNGWFCFASEIKSLLALELFEPRLNESRVLDYLVVDFDRDDEIGTFYQNIKRLPAGHAMKVNDAGINAWRYWNPGNLQENNFSSLNECAEAFQENLRSAIKCRLRSIEPVGAMLSGGLDSSSIVAMISHEFKNDLTDPLHTYSLIRHDRDNCPDWQSIQKILETENWIQPKIITSALRNEICQTFLEQIPNIDEPFGLSHGLNYFIVYKAASENGCKVVLDGLAGDLLFYGENATLRSMFNGKRIQQIFGRLAANVRLGNISATAMLIRIFLGSVMPEFLRNVYQRSQCLCSVYRDDLKLLHPETARSLFKRRYDQRFQAGAHYKTSNDQLYHARRFTSGTISFPHEVYGQIAQSMGVEPRSPFSDRRMIEFAVQMPVEAKWFLSWYKHILRINMDGLLPEEVQWRKDIGGHPGWKFYQKLISETAHHKPEILDVDFIGNILYKWISRYSLNRIYYKYNRGESYSEGLNLYVLAILAQWLTFQPKGMQPK